MQTKMAAFRILPLYLFSLLPKDSQIAGLECSGSFFGIDSYDMEGCLVVYLYDFGN